MSLQTWRRSVRQRLDDLNWDHVVADVRPFLERQHDVELVNKDNAMRLLVPL